MPGDLDLFGGGAGGYITGVNNFHVDKSPLDQFEGNIAGAIKAEWKKRLENPFDVDGAWLDFIEALKDSLQDWVASFFQGLSIDLSQILEVIAKVLHFPKPNGVTLPELSDWSFDALFGLIFPNRVPVLPISHLTNRLVNLLTNPMFTGDPFMPQNQGEWILDLSTSQNGVGGSARIDANGEEHNLLSVDLIPVTPGQKFEVAAWIKTRDFVAAAGSVVIGVAEYANADGSGEPVYKSVAKPTQTGTTDWKQWGGTYAVPRDGVEALRVHLEVTLNATTGSIWIDNLFAGKKGLLALDWVDGLNDNLQDLWDGFEAVVLKIADFLNIDEIVAFLEKLTGLNINEGPVAFIRSVIDRIRALFGVNLLSPGHLFESIKDAFEGLIHTIQQIIAKFEEKTGLNIDEGPIAFLQSLIAKIKARHGIDLQSPNHLFASIQDVFEGIVHTLQEIVSHIEAKTGLNIDEGPLKFLQSLIAKIKSLNGIDLDSPDALFGSIQHLVQRIVLTIQEIITQIETKTGLNIDAGPAEFLKSLTARIKTNNGVDLGSQTQLLGSLQHLLAPIHTPVAWQNFLDKVGGQTGASQQTLADRLQNLNSAGKFNALQLNGLVPNTQVSGLTIGGQVYNSIGDVAQANHANMQSTWDKWMAALTGVQNATGDPVLTSNQIAELMATVVANATAIAQIQAETQASGGGMSGGDDFERPADVNGIGTGWQFTTSDATGSRFVADGRQAWWKEAGKATKIRYWRVDPKDSSTKTGYQSITRVNGTTLLQSGLGQSGEDTILGRVSTDGKAYVIAAVDNKKVYLRYSLTGTEIELDSEDCPGPAVGTRYTLECGQAGSYYTYRVLRNGVPILTYTDTAKATAPLDNNRCWGFGGSSRFAALAGGELGPSSVNAVTVFDNVPTTTAGTYLRVYRENTGTVTHPDGDSVVPNSCFDTVERQSINLGWEAVSQTLTITEPGPYHINARLEFSKDITSTDRWDLLLYRKKANESAFALAPTVRGPSQGGAQGSSGRAVAGMFSIYLEPGDQVRLGIGSATTPLVPDIQITGDAGGSRTWMVVTRGG